jgi:hypothetical protein
MYGMQPKHARQQRARAQALGNISPQLFFCNITGKRGLTVWCFQSRTKRWSWPSGHTPGSRQAQEICSSLQAESLSGTRYRTAAEEAFRAGVAVLWRLLQERCGPAAGGLEGEERRNLAAEVESQHTIAVLAVGTFGLAETAQVCSGLGRQEVADAQHRGTAGIGS